MPVSRETFDAERRPRFGTTNPERMRLAFWEWMIRGDDDPPPDDGDLLGRYGLMMRHGRLKAGSGPYRARDYFQVPPNRADGPIWTFDRMGATRTELPDGRVVCVGGEHEDWYDPDFCIYNDVVVLGPGDAVEIYGYPKDVFPPTDFHTASLVGGRIILTGRLGYTADRRPGHTPVYALDPDGYRIAPVETTGPGPGWLHEHKAAVAPDGTITVTGGRVFDEWNGKVWCRGNFDEYSLDPQTGIWRRLTNVRWQQFIIYRVDLESFPTGKHIRPEDGFAALLPGTESIVVENEWNKVHFCSTDYFVSVTLGWRDVEVVVFGVMPDESADRIVEAVRVRTEELIENPCAAERVYRSVG